MKLFLMKGKGAFIIWSTKHGCWWHMRHMQLGNHQPRHWTSFPEITWWRHQMETFFALLGFVRGIHRSPVNSPHKGQWRGALMFSLICVWINGWVNNREAGDERRYSAHYDVTVIVRPQHQRLRLYATVVLTIWLNVKLPVPHNPDISITLQVQ